MDDDKVLETNDTDINQTENSIEPVNIPNSNKLNPDAPDFVKELYKNNNIPLELSVDYQVDNPYQVVLPGGFYSSSSIRGTEEKPSILDTAKAQFYRMNYSFQGANAFGDLYNAPDPFFDIKPDAWTSKTDIEKYVNIREEYMPALLKARSPREQQYIANKIYKEQKLDDDVKNGSWLGWLVGGALGMATDLMTYIPITSWVKYGKISSSFIQSTMKALPGSAAYGVLSSWSEQADKVNGNLHDFLIDSFTRTAFTTVLFGGVGAASSLVERMGLWELKKFAKADVEGVDFKFKVNEKGEIDGYQLIDKSQGGLSAQKLNFYEDMAKSSFYKSGVFKIPYLGESIIKLAGMPVFGSPLINLINSKSQVMRSIIDRVADHNFYTKGIAEGEVAPRKFASLMNQEYANLRDLSVQYDALFFERNGIKFENRTAASIAEKALFIKNKGMEFLQQKLDKDTYVSREKFNQEVNRTLYSKEKSEHSSVNEAAAIQRKQMDTTYTAFRKAYNLPKDWINPITAEAFISRVYNTPYMNLNRNQWINVISNWLKDADTIISERMSTINQLTSTIKDFESKHTQAVYILANYKNKRIEGKKVQKNKQIGQGIIEISNSKEIQKGTPEYRLKQLRDKLKLLKEELQNELRSNPNLILHVDDLSALSANEAKTLTQLLKPVKKIEKQLLEEKNTLSKIKNQSSRKLSNAKNETNIKKPIPKSESYVEHQKIVKEQEQKVYELERKRDTLNSELQDKAHNGEINPILFKKDPDSFQYIFKNPKDRLKFRKTYDSHLERETHALAYYNTILNQTPEDTINQTMGRFTGNTRENPLKSRTLLLPDKILYDAGFLSTDVMARVSNYTSYLARRTHLKNIFNDVTIDGGFEPVISELQSEFERAHVDLSNKKTSLENKLSDENLSIQEKKKTEKELKKVDKDLVKERKLFDKNKNVLNHLYEKMMGIQKTSRRAQQIRSAIMSITSWVNLPFVPLTQINDLSAIGLQHGIWAFVRDGLYPLVESLGGILKTKDSEALRKAAPSVHLALQDVQMGYADRNWSMMTNPYLNLGRVVNTLEKIAHFSSNFTGTNYIDNFLQRITGSVVQSELMRILHEFKLGILSKRDSRYLLKYGIDPNVWADRMLAAFKKNGGGKTRLGGYQSHFWHWEDQEASNIFGDAVFRSIKDTQISAGIIDAPLFTDDNGPIGIMGSFLRGFNGWAFASVNRYVIPSLQQADAEKLIGVLTMLGTGYLVDPFRRVARGEEMFPDSLSAKQIFWASINNSGYFSFFANILSNANLIAGGNLLGNLRSDKYKNRTRAGLLGPAWGTVNRMADIISALASGEMNEADAKKMARMIPIANASWTWWMSSYLIEKLGLPKTKAEARAEKEF